MPRCIQQDHAEHSSDLQRKPRSGRGNVASWYTDDLVGKRLPLARTFLGWNWALPFLQPAIRDSLC